MRVHRYRHFSRIVEGGGIETDYEYHDSGRWTLAADTKELEEENAALKEENARLHVRLNALARNCDTCGEVCEDSILEHWIEKAKSYEKALRDIRDKSSLHYTRRWLVDFCDKALGGWE